MTSYSPSLPHAFQGYSARYDETQRYLLNSQESIGIKPSRSKLAGSIDLTSNPLSNEESQSRQPPKYAHRPCPPLAKNYASSLGNAEEGNVQEVPHIVWRILSHWPFIRVKEDRADSATPYTMFKYITGKSLSAIFDSRGVNSYLRSRGCGTVPQRMATNSSIAKHR